MTDQYIIEESYVVAAENNLFSFRERKKDWAKEIRSHPYNPHFAPCIGHKVWKYCPTQEQIRKDEREKVLEEVLNLIPKYPTWAENPVILVYPLVKRIEALRQEDKVEK